MSGYRCVNYYELCRLCTSSTGTKSNIFSDENKKKNLASKIIDVLPVLHLDEKDKLPKIICTQCLQNIETYADFRETSINAQNMLQSCLNSTKLCNGGQVYIKDQASVKKTVPQTVTIASPLKNEISLTPINNATTVTPSSDFLSSIMQAVGIQMDENESHTNTISAQSINQSPQFRITFDPNNLKSGNQVQYKIQQEQPSTSYITTSAAPTTNEQNQNTTLAQVNEFLKLKTPQKVTPKRPELSKIKNEPKLKKARIQVLASPIKTITTKNVQQQQQPTQLIQQQVQMTKQVTAAKTATVSLPIKAPQQQFQQQTQQIKSTPIQIQDIKFLPTSSKCMVPIVLKNSGDATQQIFSQFATTADSKPVAYLQMKIEPNSDGQPCVQLTPAQMPTTLQLTPQQLQQFGFQTATQIQAIPVSAPAPPPQQIQIQQQIFSPHTVTTPTATTTTTTLQTNTTASQTQTAEEPEDDGVDDSVMDTSPMDIPEEVETKPIVRTVKSAAARKKSTPAIAVTSRSNAPTTSASTRTYTTASQIPKHQSQLATKQLDAIAAHKDPTTPAKTVVINEQTQQSTEEQFSLTKCEVCDKVFKKKEHLLQHLKTHIGLRPFRCDDKSGCNKSFNRKEHLLRHVISHTGKKMFNCDLCHKYFSRKDNLNKHRRTHPEVGGVNSVPYQCDLCERSFIAKSQYLKHKVTHHGQNKDDEIEETTETTNIVTNTKNSKIRNVKNVAIRKIKQETNTNAGSTINNQQTMEQELPQQQQQVQIQQPPALQIIKQQQQTTTQIVQQQITPQQIIQILPSSMVASNTSTITINQQQQQQIQQQIQQQVQQHQQQHQPKTTIIKTLNADGNTTVYTIPSNLILNPAQFMTGEVMANFKIENAN